MMQSTIPGLVAVLMLLVGVAPATAAGGPNMTEGLWEITTTMSMPGMPMQLPPVVTKQCLTRKDIVPDGGPQHTKNCAPADITIDGDTVRWSLSCTEQGTSMTGSGHITYRGTSFEGEMRMQQADMTMTSTLRGKHLGPCP
jgi:hypothetical protein